MRDMGGPLVRAPVAASATLARIPRDRPARAVAAAVAFAVVTAAIAVVQAPPIGITDASSLYLIAVVLVASFGTRPAIAAAVGAFLLYDLLFVEPRFTLTVDDPREWLDLALFLVAGTTIGRLAGRQSERAREAERRRASAAALFRVSRTLATAETVAAAVPDILRQLVDSTRMDRIRFGRQRGTRETIEGDEGTGPVPGATRIATVLVRTPGNEPARWVRSHHAGSPAAATGSPDHETFQVRVEADDAVLGSLWASRAHGLGLPDVEETRLLSLAADQLALALVREQLASEAKDADLARRAESVGRALLESVTHDLRTPLASIRATAGSLADPSVAWTDDERRAAAARIDAEAERLNRLVGNLLDLSRIEGGTLVPAREPWDVATAVEAVVARVAAELPADRIRIVLPGDLPPVLVDPVLLDQALANVLENALLHAPGAPVTISAAVAGPADDQSIVVRVEDAGPGVPDAALGRLFERFYRAPQGRPAAARRGLGIGLAVVRGALESMGGSVTAEAVPTGGLAIVLGLPVAPAPLDETP
jgi:two-component system sensor histidine kinase KdpD